MSESTHGLTLAGTTAWARNVPTPLREFLSTETGSAAVLLAATLAALVWVNIDASSYTSVWTTELSIHVGSHGIALDLQEWINGFLMAFFFFVVGLEARREFDMGELRERRRVALPALAGLGGILVPVAIYLAFNAGHSSAHGWGTAMSTDTAFALGMLALVGPRFPDRLQAFMLTVVIVDDMVALGVIAIVYAEQIQTADLLKALALLAVALLARLAGIHYGIVYLVLGIGAWLAMEQSGVDPVVVGLVMGLVVSAYPAARVDLERASDLFREFREQPTAELAASATAGVKSAISPNVRLQQLFHPWTSYVIVPLFALANAGIVLSWSFLSGAFTSPITLGIVIGYVVGKPVGIAGTAWLVKTPHPGPAASAGRLGGRRRRRHHRGHRLHRVDPDRDAGLHRHRAAAGQAGRADRRAHRVAGHMARVSGDRDAPEAAAGAGADRLRRRDHRPRRRGRSRARPHPRAAGSPCDRGRIRRLRVPLLRAGRVGRARSAGRLRRRAVRVAAPAR